MASRSDGPRIIKKYGNRRLYDTRSSGYITQEELTERIRGGDEVQVLDAQTGEDLTQVTLTQLIIEGRGAAKLLPVPLLVQLIRMGDEALAEFLGRYMAAALELYLRARSGAQVLGQYNPLATVPFTAADALARLMLSPAQWLSQGPFGFGQPSGPPVMAPAMAPVAAPTEPQPPPPAAPATAAAQAQELSELSQIRRDFEELKRALTAAAPPPPRPKARPKAKRSAAPKRKS